jgi:serine phosphatase RsbU (regulator of sigma subunit)
MTIKKEKLLKETYNKFIQTSLMDLPLDGIEAFVDPNIMGYGTASDERILSISEYRALVLRQREQGKDIEMTFDIAPVLHRITGNGDSALFIDEITLKMIINNETHKLFMRLSSVLEYREEKWFALHFHGSLPGEAEGETDTWHINEWQKKNEKLERMVAEKTADLEIKNRELEIETALERVRTKTMAMYKSDELGASIYTLFNQLRELGIPNISNAISLVDSEKDTMEIWATWGDRIVRPVKVRATDHENFKKEIEAWQKEQDIKIKMSVGVAKTALKNIFDIDLIVPENVSFWHLLQIWHQYGFIVLGTWEEASDEERRIIKRFAKVFEQTYTRFLDLQNAEEQAREAQIEAALERVRSRTMAMHKSDELSEVVAVLYEQLKPLGVASWGCEVILCDAKKDKMEYWHSDMVQSVLPECFYVSGNDHPILKKQWEAWKNGDQNLIIELMDQEKLDFDQFLFEKTDFKMLPENIKKEILSENKVVFSHASMKYGLLEALDNDPVPKEKINILNRFAKVFEQTYTRFLDLQKAEVQAREGQIELALERVRAKTMAMQISSELAETAAHLFAQLNDLGIKPYRCNIAIVDAESNKCQLWSTTNSGNVIPISSSIPLDEYSVFKDVYDGWKAQKVGHIIKLVGEERVSWTKYITQYVSFDEYKPQNIKKGTLQNETAIFSNFYFRQGFFVIHTIEDISGADLKIIQRFAHVFEQTYTRFLDLQNAEAQNKIIRAENERKTKELEEARELQLAMLPKELPQLPHLDIAVYMQTATEVGGDYYDFSIKEDGSLNIAIGDATGHGMKAGIMVSSMKSIFTTNAPKMDIEPFFATANSGVKSMQLKRMMMGFSMLNINKNKFQLVNAGMPPIFLFRKSSGVVEEITEHGMPIGAMKLSQYNAIKGSLEKGDVLLLMSDGLPELQNDKEEMYGYKRIRNGFEDVAGKAPEEIIAFLKNEGKAWNGDQAPDDDVTFVVIKVK